ncbi:MAG: hypothetical protein L0Z62_24940 [Gemmataceae bacterium]|nr:hypothetical protein [Gemmataceae bacterium]
MNVHPNGPPGKRPGSDSAMSLKPGPQPCNQIAPTAAEQIARALSFPQPRLDRPAAVRELLGLLTAEPHLWPWPMGRVLADLLAAFGGTRRRSNHE